MIPLHVRKIWVWRIISVGLNLRRKPGVGTPPITFDNSYTNPLLFEAGKLGGSLEVKLYARSSNSLSESLTNCHLTAVDSAGLDESTWFSFALDVSGGAGVYSPTLDFEIPLGAELPIWIRVDVPANVEFGAKRDVKLRVAYISSEV